MNTISVVIGLVLILLVVAAGFGLVSVSVDSAKTSLFGNDSSDGLIDKNPTESAFEQDKKPFKSFDNEFYAYEV